MSAHKSSLPFRFWFLVGGGWPWVRSPHRCPAVLCLVPRRRGGSPGCANLPLMASCHLPLIHSPSNLLPTPVPQASHHQTDPGAFPAWLCGLGSRGHLLSYLCCCLGQCCQEPGLLLGPYSSKVRPEESCGLFPSGCNSMRSPKSPAPASSL